MTLHATAVALGDCGLLLVGPPGAGKSDLALRLVDRGALLVADDRVDVSAHEGAVRASPPATIAGLLEIRGLGLVRLPHRVSVRLALVLDLGRRPERLPGPERMEIAGGFLPCLAFDPWGPSAPLRAEWAVAQAASNGLWCADAP